MNLKVVIIEDDNAILELVKYNFEKEGFVVEGFGNGLDGLEYITKNLPDIVILDIMLPDIDGFEICKELKKNEKTKDIPIIMLTAKADEVDRVLGLELGADDYVVKPFSPRELIARVKAIMRRSIPERTPEILKFEDIIIDLAQHKVFVRDQEILLTATEFKILQTMVQKPSRVFTRDNLLNALDKTIIDRNIDVHITNLRKKLKSAGKYIRTVRGVGYKIEK